MGHVATQLKKRLFVSCSSLQGKKGRKVHLFNLKDSVLSVFLTLLKKLLILNDFFQSFLEEDASLEISISLSEL